MKDHPNAIEVTVSEARTQFFHLLDLAAQGKAIMIRDKKHADMYQITLLPDEERQ